MRIANTFEYIRKYSTYHPKIKSDTWPTRLLPGDGAAAGSPVGASPAAGIGAVLGFGAPGFLNADEAGASLMGVPTVATAIDIVLDDVGVPGGPELSTDMESPRVTPPEADRVCIGSTPLRTTVCPRIISASAGFFKSLTVRSRRKTRRAKHTYIPLGTDHPAPAEDVAILSHGTHRVPGVLVPDPEAVDEFGAGVHLRKVSERLKELHGDAVLLRRVAENDNKERLYM